MKQRKSSRTAKTFHYVERLQALWEELSRYRGHDVSTVSRRSVRAQARVDLLEGVFVDREPVFDSSWPTTLCDAPDADQSVQIAAGAMPGLRYRTVPGTGEKIVDTYARIQPGRFNPTGTLESPTPEEIKDHHQTGTCL